MDVTVLVCTYGDQSWPDLAQRRAIPSAERQAETLHVHAGTLCDARNIAVTEARTEWVVHLDADDELEPGYIAAMDAGQGDIRVPLVRYVRNHRTRPAVMPRVWGHRHDCTQACLIHGNWIVVGAAVRRDLVLNVGGWHDFAWSEDWDLWLRCHLHGADIQPCPDAVYRAHVRPDSRNRAPDQEFKQAQHDAIYRANFPEAA